MYTVSKIMLIIYMFSESCEGLDKIDSSPLLDCDINENCLSMDCNVTSFAGHGAILILLPCDRPLPALKLLLKSPSGTTSLGKFDSSEPRRTTTASLSDAATFVITISWASTNIATIEVANMLYEGYSSCIPSIVSTLPTPTFVYDVDILVCVFTSGGARKTEYV